jgi:hypothetical protein
MAKIDTSKIEGYANMTAEQKLAALEAYDHPDPDLTGFVEKSKLDKATAEAAEWKRKHNALLSDEDKRKQEEAESRAAMEQELADLRKEKTVAQYKAQYLAQGYSDKLATETAQALADGDTAKVFANQQKFLDEYAKTVKADALKKMPKPGSGGTGGDTPKTREEIMKIKDTAERQAAIAANLDLFGKGE